MENFSFAAPLLRPVSKPYVRRQFPTKSETKSELVVDAFVRSRRHVNENARGPGNARLFESRKAGDLTRRELESRG